MGIYQLTLSVHQLVDFLLRSGDIDNRVFNKETMNEGSRLHALYQSKQNNNYLAEYNLKQTFHYQDYDITLQGRADGIIIEKDTFIIDEIKTSVEDLNTFKEKHLDWHLGQAKCYALMFCKERKLNDIQIRISYFRQGKKDKLFLNFTFQYDELLEFINNLFEQYLNFYNIILRNRILLNESIKNLPFPFKNYRNGQQKLAKFVYFVGKQRKKLFVQAPTGIGKTMSCLYPFAKLLKDNSESKIFYLTAKNSGKLSAGNAIEILKNKGLKAHSIIVTAKEKICPYVDKNCNPDECPLTKSYYNNLARVLSYCLEKYDNFNQENIFDIALKESMCPFELSLDLSLYCDIIVCDYNYFFDPLVYMKRYFDEDASNFLLLIDEAHNLVDRSKEMYSANINFDNIKKYKKENKNIDNKKLKRIINKLYKLSKLYDSSCQDEYTVLLDLLEDTNKIFKNFYNVYLDISKNESKLINSRLTDIFLDINKFIKIYELYSDNYILYFHKKIIKNKSYDLNLTLKCLDASKYLSSLLKNVKSSVFFSATLTPFNYYADVLGGDKNIDPYLSLPSPFPIENMLMMIAPNISIKYKKRLESYQIVSDYIKTFISHQKGNYFVFTPSYEYLNNLIPYLDEINAKIVVQTTDMDDIKKQKFLDNFTLNPDKTTVGVVVLGGAFSEGIDLVSDRLIGAVIIGVGLPKVSFELDAIAKYYDKLGMPGLDYAYVDPGMNKVMQAVGRVIRSEKDKGAILLIDERYTLNKYQDLFKSEWRNYQVVFNKEDINQLLLQFYKK